MLIVVQLQLLWYWLKGMDFTTQYKMLERRRVYIRMLVEERTKKVRGQEYSNSLLLSCEKYLEAMPKPRFTVYAESVPRKVNANSITKKYRDAEKYDESWPEVHDSFYV